MTIKLQPLVFAKQSVSLLFEFYKTTSITPITTKIELAISPSDNGSRFLRYI